MYSAPHDESPICAMPQAAQQHGNEKVNVSAPLSSPASSQRYIEVIAQPCTQADVPTSPEILEAVSKVWLAKVEHEMKTEQLSAAACEVAVTAEIAINLPG